MNSLFQNVVAQGDVPEFLADAAAKSAAVFAAACLVALILRRRSASARHLMWSLAVTASLLLPLLSLSLPRWPILPIPQETAAQVGEQGALGPVAELPTPPPRMADQPEVPALGPIAANEMLASAPTSADGELVAQVQAPPEPRHWLFTVWLAGTGLALLPLAGGWWQLWRLRRICGKLAADHADQLLDQLATSLGLRRKPLLVASNRRAIPMTWGIFRPVILLPESAGQWPEARLRAVLLHELAHVQRCDCLMQCLGQVARALYWFNPLAWVACVWLRIEQEQSCDDRVLGAGHDAADYAEHLLAVMAKSQPDRLPRVALAAARGFRQVRRRLQRILDPASDRRPLTRLAAAVAFVTVVALVLPIACVRLDAAEAEGARQQDATAPAAGADKEAARVAEVRAKLLEHHVGHADEKQLAEGAIRGMVRALDDAYADYLDPEKNAEMQKALSGTLQGVGLMLELKGGQPAVVTPLAGSPALKAGLRPGDILVEVDGKPTQGVPLAQLVKLIAGPADTSVKLKFRRDGRDTEVPVTRAPIRVESVTGFRRGADQAWAWMMDPEGKIGYVRIAQFGPDTTAALGEALKQLKDAGAKGLILDLRFCPGGLLSAAVDASRLFLSEGTIVSVKSPKGDAVTHKAEAKATFAEQPLLVLIDEQTASAAEVMAGALQENHRAVLLGARTYGKGSVQSLIPVEAGGVLKVTTAYYHLPDGRNIHRRPGQKTWGVDPDDGYYVPRGSKQTEALLKQRRQRDQLPAKDPGQGGLTPKQIEEEHADSQLAAALRTMTARIKDGSYVKVGKSTRELMADIARGQPLRERREALLKELEKLDRDLDELPKGNSAAPAGKQ